MLQNHNTPVLCTHPNNNSQKFQNSNPEIKWINGELNNKLFYKIFLIILKWFYFSTPHYKYLYMDGWKWRRGGGRTPLFSIRTYRKRWCIQHTFSMIYFTCIIIGNNIQCCTQNISKKKIGKIRNESYRYFTPRFHTQQPPLKYSVMYGYSMM